MDVGGYVSRGFEGVRDAFASAQAADEGGGQLCIYRRGEKVVDLWAGRDPVNDRPYGEDAITVIMSCTKGATTRRGSPTIGRSSRRAERKTRASGT